MPCQVGFPWFRGRQAVDSSMQTSAQQHHTLHTAPVQTPLSGGGERPGQAGKSATQAKPQRHTPAAKWSPAAGRLHAVEAAGPQRPGQPARHGQLPPGLGWGRPGGPAPELQPSAAHRTSHPSACSRQSATIRSSAQLPTSSRSSPISFKRGLVLVGLVQGKTAAHLMCKQASPEKLHLAVKWIQNALWPLYYGAC